MNIINKKFLFALCLFALSAIILFAITCTEFEYDNPYDSQNLGNDGGEQNTAEYCRWDGDPHSCLIIEDGMAAPPQDTLTNRENCIRNSAAHLVFASEEACRAWESDEILFSCFWAYNPPHNEGSACWDRSRTVEKCLEEYGSVVATCVPMCSRCDNIFDCKENYPNGCDLNGGPTNWNEATTVCTKDENCPTDIGSCKVGTTCTFDVQRNVCSGVFDISGECQAATAPAAPTGVNAVAVSSTSIRITWYAVTGEAGAEEYRVYRSASSNGTYARIGTTAETEYIDNNLTPNTRYYYMVVAVNQVGQSENSSAASATTLEESGGAYTYYCPTTCAEQMGASVPANCFADREECELVSALPAAPTGVTVNAVLSVTGITITGNMQIRWNAVAGATSYTVYRNLNADSVSWFAAVGTTTTTLTFTDVNLTPGRAYFYAVKANNSAGSSEYSQIVQGPTVGTSQYLYCCWVNENTPNGDCHPMGPGETIFGNKGSEAECRADYGIPSATDQTGTMTIDWCHWPDGCFAILNSTEEQNCIENSAPHKTFPSLNACMAWESDVPLVSCFWGYDPEYNNGALCWSGIHTAEKCKDDWGTVVNSCAALCNQCTASTCSQSASHGCERIGGPTSPPAGMTVID